MTSSRVTALTSLGVYCIALIACTSLRSSPSLRFLHDPSLHVRVVNGTDDCAQRLNIDIDGRPLYSGPIGSDRSEPGGFTLYASVPRGRHVLTANSGSASVRAIVRRGETIEIVVATDSTVRVHVWAYHPLFI
jgi:hypothetical protein